MFSQILKDRRLELGITQQDMAEKLFVTRQTVSNWENGKNFPDIPTLISISENYSLSLDYMLKGDLKYMKKVEEDYKLIKKRKRERISSYIIAVSLILIVLLCLSNIFLKNRFNENFLATIVILICIPLVASSYILYKSFYKTDNNAPQPLFIPKAYGPGLTINPNHPIGKIIWIIIGISILVLLFYSILSL